VPILESKFGIILILKKDFSNKMHLAKHKKAPFVTKGAQALL
jgi:hypothetical protein